MLRPNLAHKLWPRNGYLKNGPTNPYQILGDDRGTPPGSYGGVWGGAIVGKIWGLASKKISSWGADPQTGSGIRTAVGGIPRGLGEAHDGERKTEKFRQGAELSGIKEKPLAPPSGTFLTYVAPPFWRTVGGLP